MSQYERTELLLGKEKLDKLNNSTVLVVGIGGVGSYACETLARSGIGRLILVDKDDVSLSNLNRQIHATLNTVNKSKVHMMKERIQTFNPECEVICFKDFYSKELLAVWDYQIDVVIDAIDTMTSKMDLIEECALRKIPIISSMGMANRLDPTQVIITTLDKTSNDPVSKVMRELVKKRKFNKKITVAFSKEIPVKQNTVVNEDGATRKEKIPPASMIFVPAAAGLACGYYAITKCLERID